MKDIDQEIEDLEIKVKKVCSMKAESIWENKVLDEKLQTYLGKILELQEQKKQLRRKL
jgi:hypothetical protein